MSGHDDPRVSDPAAIRPATYLAAGWRSPDGALRADLAGLNAFGTALRFQHDDLPPAELNTVLEAMRQVLPETDGSADARLVEAIDTALAAAAAILGQEPSPVLEDWLTECAGFVHTEDDLAAFEAHSTAVARQYTALIATASADQA